MHELSSANLVFLIPGLPLLGFLIHAFFGRRLGRQAVGTIGTGVVFLSFVVSLYVLLDLMNMEGEHRRAFASLIPFASDVPWIHIGDFRANYSALIDPLSLLMCLIVTGVGGLIHLYATGYMADDRDYPRFFTYFNLFIFFMLTLVLAENILLMFVGWEGVGLCSYLLISYWYDDPKEGVENSKAGNKAFIVNRIGDVGFALGIMLIFATFGTLAFYAPDGTGFLDWARKGTGPDGQPLKDIALLIGLLLFIGACGKSAQFPLHVWLPDAMAGPTPVSALIHAATMVTAGVVMVARVSPLLVHSTVVMTVIACVGLFTALFAASIALTQNDIKKVLAYSTVSQLGYMFLGCGVGAFAAGMFHVTTHAFFKALLFLGAGSVILALHHEQDMRRMGGLAKKIPKTHWTMVCAWLAICGIFPFAGFWSKDEILHAASGAPGNGLIYYVVGLVTAAMTAFYMSRLMWKTFWTNQRFDETAPGTHDHGGQGDHGAEHGDAGHGHTGVKEPSMAVIFPLIVLAVLSVFGGLIGIPDSVLAGGNRIEHFLEPSVAPYEAHEGPITVYLGMALGLGAGLCGILLAWNLYSKKRETGELLTAEQRVRNPLYRGAASLWGVDGFFYRVFVTEGGRLANFIWQGIDRFVIDGLVNLLAYVTAFFSEVFRRVQTGYVRNYALSMLIGVVLIVIGLLWGRVGK